jgi:hypothetical protein
MIINVSLLSRKFLTEPHPKAGESQQASNPSSNPAVDVRIADLP